MPFQVTKLENALALRELKNDLTFFHGVSTCGDPEIFESMFGWIHRIREKLRPRVRLHVDSVLLLYRPRGAAEILNDWLAEQGFHTDLPCRWSQARSQSPIEDGFLHCVRAIGPSGPATDSLGELNWRDWDDGAASQRSVGEVLAGFMESETQRIGNCLHYLDALYKRPGCPSSSKLFDPEHAYLEFAAAVVSADELRFWSRLVHYPK